MLLPVNHPSICKEYIFIRFFVWDLQKVLIFDTSAPILTFTQAPRYRRCLFKFTVFEVTFWLAVRQDSIVFVRNPTFVARCYIFSKAELAAKNRREHLRHTILRYLRKLPSQFFSGRILRANSSLYFNCK